MNLMDIDKIRESPAYAEAVSKAIEIHEKRGYGMGVWVQAIDEEPRTIFVRPTHPNALDMPWGRPFAAWTLFDLPRLLDLQ